MHDLLPTQERVARLGGNRGNRAPGVCRRCQEDIEESKFHAFYSCPSSLAASTSLLTILRSQDPDLLFQDILHLQLSVEASRELSMVTAILAGLQFIWEARQDCKVAEPARLKAELEARAHILMQTRHQNDGHVLNTMLGNFPL